MPPRAETETTITYGKRPAVYALKVIRAMVAQRAALAIGPDGFALVAAVAEAEDRRHYRSPAQLFNGALVDICGFADERALVKARNKAIAAGWLAYRQGAKRRPGVYAALIPDKTTTDDDRGFTDVFVGESLENTPTLSPTHSPADLQGNPKYTHTFTCKNAGPSYPYPNTEEPPPPPSKAEAQKAEGEEALMALAKAGCNDLSVVADALAAGMTVAEILAVIDHFAAHPGKWGPGAIAWRLRTVGKTVLPADGWPPPNAAWLERERERKAAERRSAPKQESRQAKLERRFGGQLNAASDVELAEIIASLSQYEQSRAAKIIAAGTDICRSSMRVDLLEAVARLQTAMANTS